MRIRLLIALSLLVHGTAIPAETPPAVGKATPAATTAPAKTLDWEDLLPEDARKNYIAGPPPAVHDYLLGESGPAVRQELDFSVNKALEGRRIRLPGFVVPLEFDFAGKVTEFFLVPYFGACIHVPPPAPNQMIYVRVQTPFKLDSLDTAFWVTGMLSIQQRQARLGAAAYALTETTLEQYKD